MNIHVAAAGYEYVISLASRGSHRRCEHLFREIKTIKENFPIPICIYVINGGGHDDGSDKDCFVIGFKHNYICLFLRFQVFY